ncbi:thiamine kinase [Ruegeria sp. THAF57]|uniref:phosphotransferase family protein n=1 Tax=Ruegeria sp. THAF57 TaxID=2744555 RepID=UPI0017702324|nr:aminoglycoside phosphotransferase family protein [Ruegeria sp. THAF57]CAD0186177.1 thiamine kinase [Ruegeria sp. THAF57]
MPYDLELDLRAKAGQSFARFDSLTELVNLLPDQTAPPRDLFDHLRSTGLVDANARFQTLYGGRTNQVWKVLGGDGDKVLKLYRSKLRNPLFRNDAELEARCLNALEPMGFAPRLRATGKHDNGLWVFYDHAPGSPWQSGTTCVAELLRKLHMLDISIEVPAGCNGSADLAHQTQQILNMCLSDQKAQLARMRPDSPVPATNHTCLVHGDPVAGNILVDATGLTLIDWQCPARGDPCEDIALFLSPAMQQLYRGAPLRAAEEAQFLSAYDRPEITHRYRELQKWYAWRMAAYCLWRVENGATDYSAALDLEIAALG